MGSESGQNGWERDWVGAHAEKHLRDIAREPDILPEEKEVFDGVAERRGNAAMRDFDTNQTKRSDAEKQPESQDRNQELVAITVEFIKRSPGLTFFVYGNGNVLGVSGGNTIGGVAYFFDSRTRKMLPTDEFSFAGSGVKDGEEYFKIQWISESREDKKWEYLKFPFSVEFGSRNAFCTEDRGGTHLTLGIRYDENALSSLGNKEIEEKIRKSDKGFLNKLLWQCGREFIPGYTAHILSLYKKHRESTRG